MYMYIYTYVLFLALIKNLSSCPYLTKRKIVLEADVLRNACQLCKFCWAWVSASSLFVAPTVQLQLDSCMYTYYYHLQIIVHAYSISVKFRQKFTVNTSQLSRIIIIN